MIRLKSIKRTEKSIQKEIQDFLKLSGFLVVRLPPSIYSDKGIPDLYFLKNGIGGFIEVKGPNGKQTEKQKEFEQRVKERGGNYIIATSLEDVVNQINIGGLK